MRKTLTFIFFCYFLTLPGISQQNSGSFYVTGKIKVDQGVVDGTVIALYRNNALLKNIDVNRTGSFRIAVDLNHTYRFVFNNPFYYSKTIEIDTHVPSEARASDAVFPPYQLSLMLYRKVPGVNETQQEIGRISYNPKIDQFDAELIRQETDFKKLIDEALSEIKEKSRLYETQTAKAKKQKYAQHIADADHFFRTGKYSEAMNEYRQAVLSQPSELYPRNKVDEAYRILIAEQLHHSFGPPGEDNFLKYLNYGDAQFAQREYSHARVAYSLALKFRPDDENVKRKLAESEVETAKLQDLALAEVRHRDEVYALRTQRYRELIAKGDQKFRAEVIAAARDFYAQAATQIDENSYALLMLQKIGDILSNDEMALKLARERDEAQKKRLIEARNRAYDDAIHEADARFHQGDFQQALENYELALTIKSFELYPRQQINAINDIRAKMQISGEEYRRLLREGEDLMARFEYGTARNSFVKAHALIPNEQYALEKIAAIDNILAQQNEQNKIDTQYRQEIESADRLYAEKKYNEAIAGYQKALKWKPDESYPFDQIQRIRGILSRESDEQKRIQQRQSDYDQMVRKADEAFDQQSYAAARSLYLKALQIIPGQEYPSAQIRRIDSLLAREREPEKAVLSEIDFSNLGNLSDEKRKAAYNEAMALGESFFKSKDWGVARFYFRRALALYPNDEIATQKLKDTDAKIGGSENQEIRYREMIEKAEDAFEKGDFTVSKFYYHKALEAKPSDPFASERLQIVDKMLSATSTRNQMREYTDAMNNGLNAFQEKNYSLARFYYRKALSLVPNDEKATQSLQQVDRMLQVSKQANDLSEYENNCRLGDQSLEQKQYAAALNYYRNALVFKPGDTYILQQIQKVDEAMRSRK